MSSFIKNTENEKTAIVVIDEWNHNTLTSKDREFIPFCELGSIEKYPNQHIFHITYTDYDKFIEWVKRNNGRILTGKQFERALISLKVGDIEDRISDALKFNQLTIQFLYNIMNVLTNTQKGKFNTEMRNAISLFDNIRKSTPVLYNVDLKESYSKEFEKLLTREKNVADIIQQSREYFNNEEN